MVVLAPFARIYPKDDVCGLMLFEFLLIAGD